MIRKIRNLILLMTRKKKEKIRIDLDRLVQSMYVPASPLKSKSKQKWKTINDLRPLPQSQTYFGAALALVRLSIHTECFMLLCFNSKC